MTTDIANQKSNTGSTTNFRNLTLASAALTLIFALLAMILGSRLSNLQTDYLNTEKKAVSAEATSIQELENTIKTANKHLEQTQQALKAEKANADRFRRQHSVALKDLEKSKIDLIRANQTIAELRSGAEADTASAVKATKPAASPEKISPSEIADTLKPQPQVTLPPTNPPVTAPVPDEKPAVIPPKIEDTSGSEPPAGKTETPVEKIDPTSKTSSSIGNPPPLTEKTIPHPTPITPSTAPAAD